MRLLLSFAVVAALLGAVPAAAQTPASPTATATSEAPSAREVVIAALRRNMGGTDRVYAAPRIPDDIARNAREAGALTPDQELLGVTDSTANLSGRQGVYFLADHIVVKRAASRRRIYYDQLRGVEPRFGTFVIEYGEIMVGANLVGKERVAAIIADILQNMPE